MTTPLHIAVLLGGPSAEREVSLRSGGAVSGALKALGHHVTCVDPVPGNLRIPPGTDVAFLALHGTYGEDGTVQSELESLGIPYTGCGVEASRTAFDKVLTKVRLVDARIPTARSAVFRSPDSPWPGRDWSPPVVLKPIHQGSSVGLQFVDDVASFPSALRESFRHDSGVLMEERILGRETTVGILADAPLPVVEVRPQSGAYDYSSKYTAGRTEYFCPADFPAETTQRIQETAIRAFRAVGGRDYARVDIMVRKDGSPVVLEVNTLPGMTETSLLPKAAAASGMDFPALCQRMVELALGRRGARA
ncbi:MAG: D-alanine--D-alanine ligase [Verrucomicrobiales bacterium]|nr:D-alanine--D-alanine ligase [Verrucomicrobiales bacterium]